jgi:hypothetical protein
VTDTIHVTPVSPPPKRRLGRGLFAVIMWVGLWVFALLCWGSGGARLIPRPGPEPTSTAVISSADYRAPEVCADCHTTLFQQWGGTMHSFAATDPVYVGLYVLADQQTKGQAEQMCAASLCHSPVGHLAGEIPPVDGSGLSPVSARGVFCDFCHTVSRAKAVGNGAYVADPGVIKRGPYADAASPAHATAYSRLHTSSEFCALCHEVKHPKYGTPLETTYSEWKRSPYNSRDPRLRRTCQDCHMGPRAPASHGPKPGRAALGGPVRPNIYSHDMAGANVLIGQRLGDTSTARRATAFLKAAARLEVSAGTPRAGRIPVTVKVTNVGAGHSLPTGVTEMRQMWVKIDVLDARGRVISEHGALGDDGEVPDGIRVFHTVFGDQQGKPTDYIWFATKVISDDRIPPKGSRTVRYAVPSGSGRPARVVARLMYRSMPQYLADMTLGTGKVVVPVIEMARASAAL